MMRDPFTVELQRGVLLQVSSVSYEGANRKRVHFECTLADGPVMFLRQQAKFLFRIALILAAILMATGNVERFPLGRGRTSRRLPG